MDLTTEEIERFRGAWEKDFGEQLTGEQAASELARLLTFLYALAEALQEK